MYRTPQKLPDNVRVVPVGPMIDADGEERLLATGYEAYAYRWTGDFNGEYVYGLVGNRNNLVNWLMERGYMQVEGEASLYRR